MPPPGGSPGGKGDGKASPEEACVVREDAHCIDCANYSPDTGECSKVEGSYAPEDACAHYFTPANDDEGSDDQGPASVESGQ